MAEFPLGGTTTWDILQMAAAILVYGLIVNAFYQIISKRRMFASRRDISAEKDIHEAMARAKDSAAEAAELKFEADATGDKEIKEAVAAAKEEVREAVEIAAEDISRQASSSKRWLREVRSLVIFPLVGALFFVMLSANLVFIGAGRPPVEVFSLSMAILLAVRLAAYINEATSHDLAKLLPLALLGFFLVEGSFAGIKEGNAALLALKDEWKLILGFILFATIVEATLRITYLLVRWMQWNRWLTEKTARFR